MGLAHGKTLLVITPAFFQHIYFLLYPIYVFQRQIIWPLTYWEDYPQFLFPMVIKGVFPMSEESFENISSYSSHNFSNSILYLFRTSASCSLTFPMCVNICWGSYELLVSDNMSQRGFSFSMPSLCNMVSLYSFSSMFRTSAFCSLTFLQASISAGEAMNSFF